MSFNCASKNNIFVSQEGTNLDMRIFDMVADIYYCE